MISHGVVAAALLLVAGMTSGIADEALAQSASAQNSIEVDAGSVQIAFTGDTLVHMPLSARARRGSDGYDFRSMFTRVRPILQEADLAICHLEVPLSPGNDDLSGYPLFSSPREIAEALAFAGYDGCSAASNHSIDRGPQGVHDTIEILEDAGVVQAGMARSPEEAWSAVHYEVGDLRVAHISATYWLNGLRMPEDQQWLVQLLDVEELLGVAAGARRAGADLVVLSIHCCTEYRHEPTETQRSLYIELIRSPDVDLIVGHHSHVVGPIEEVDGEFILYGLGNFLSAQRHLPGVDDGVIALVEAEELPGGWAFTGIEVVPTWVQPGSYAVVPALMHNPVSHGRTMQMVNMYEPSGFPHHVWPGHPGGRLPESGI